MKSDLTKVCLALLSAVFILGCQDVGTGPVGADGLVPQFTHKDPNKEHGKPGGGGDGGGDATYTATFTGDITTVPPDELIALTASLQTLHSLLDLSVFKGKVSDGETCFGDDTFSVHFGIREGKKNDPGEAEAVSLFAFEAKGIDGETVVNYGLYLYGDHDGKLPPDPEKLTTITWNSYDMYHGGGPGKKVACTGTGSLDSETLVTHATPT